MCRLALPLHVSVGSPSLIKAKCGHVFTLHWESESKQRCLLAYTKTCPKSQAASIAIKGEAFARNAL